MCLYSCKILREFVKVLFRRVCEKKVPSRALCNIFGKHEL